MTTFALVDCNNFYCSCERLFRPELKHRPIAVLSNNDGCIVARSQEVKDLKISMATPFFKVVDQIKRHQVHVFSSNYTLYADISSRVMQTLEQFSPNLEIYSIDEAFLDLTGCGHLEEYAQQIKATVYQYVGVPVCVGMAPTKTLAKLANHAAKMYPQTRGVVDLSDSARQKRLCELVPVKKVWGVGRRNGDRLENMGIRTALQLAQMDLKVIRQKFSIVLERTIRELNGESCIELDDVPATRQQVICSRSFGSKITQHGPMREAIAEFTTRGAEKLRKEKLRACTLSVFIRTSPNANDPQYSNTATGKLLQASSDSRDFLQLSGQLFNQIWKEGYRYAKAGIMLTEICREDQLQLSLLEPPKDTLTSDRLMQAIDKINQTTSGKIRFGSQREQQDWFMNRTRLSPSYTTRWEDLPVAK